MPRAGLSTAAVVEAALAVVDSKGADALTLAAVAARTGVAAPSLYKHIDGLPGLRVLVAQRVMQEMTAAFTAAVLGRSGDDAVAALLAAFRAYATKHPARYAAVPADPLHHPGLAEAAMAQLNVLLAVLRGFGLKDSAAIHATRCARAIAHGFASIESAGGFGLAEDIDTTYDRLVRMFIASLHP